MATGDCVLSAAPKSITRHGARRYAMTKAKRILLAIAVIANPLGVPCVSAAQDEVTADAIGHLRSNLDALLVRDDLTPERVAVLKEMRAGLAALLQEDLNPLHARVLVTAADSLRGSKGDFTLQDVVNVTAMYVDMFLYGDELNDEEAAELEAKLLREPDDIVARTRLVRHYYANGRARSRRAHAEHVVWLIENAPYAHELRHTGDNDIYPSTSEAYAAGREAWRRHVEGEPENPVFVARYARFVQRSDRSLYVELLERAHGLDAGNPDLAWELGHAYLRASMHPQENAYDAQVAEKALKQFDRAYELTDNDIARNSVLRGRTEAAFAAEKYDLAKQHAQAMLDANPALGPDGDLMHWGNTILGRVALIEGDVARAKSHLLESGKVPTSPVLGSFGPSMTLASELLALGHSKVVLDYFELCAVFWKAEKLNTWRAALNAGQTPDFGNLAWLR